MFNLGNFKEGHLHLISDGNKHFPVFPLRWPTLVLERGLLKKRGPIAPMSFSTLNTICYKIFEILHEWLDI